MKTLVVVLSLALALLSLEYARKSVRIANYKRDQALAVINLLDTVSIKEKENLRISREYAADLVILRNTYETTINSVNSEYNDRLLIMENRTQHYRDLSKAGGTRCEELADRTTRYDQLIEEGRQLVIELRAALELRTNQLTTAISQLEADRKLLKGDQ